MNSTLVISVVSAVAASTATVTLQNSPSLWMWFRKTSWKIDTCIGRWWTRNEAYICHHYRAPSTSATLLSFLGTGRAPTGSTHRRRATLRMVLDLGIYWDAPCVQTG